MSQQLRVVAPQAITLYFTTSLYNGQVPAGSQRQFASSRAAYDFLNNAPECVQTNVRFPYPQGSFVYVYPSNGCGYVPPQPPAGWCPCNQPGPYY